MTLGCELMAWTKERLTTSEKFTKCAPLDDGIAPASVITMRPNRSVSIGQCLFMVSTMRFFVALLTEYGPRDGRASSDESLQLPWVPSASTSRNKRFQSA